MPAKRKLTMRHIRQMLRLAGSGTSSREIAVMLGIARSTVQDNLKRAAMAGLSWALASGLTDDVLEAKLFVHPGVKRGQRLRQEPDWGPLSIEPEEARRDAADLGRNTAAPIRWVWI